MSFGHSSGRSWQRMDAHVMYLTPISFGGALTVVHGGAIAPKSSAGHKCAFGRWSDPTLRSCSLIDRLMSGMACLALPVLRRPMMGGPWRIELDHPHSPADPSAGSLYRTSRICRTFLRLFPRSTCCCYRIFCRSYGPTAGSVHAVAIGSQAAGFYVQRSCVVAWRQQLGSTDTRLATGRDARIVNARRPGRREGIVARGFAAVLAFQAAQLAKGIAHVELAKRAHGCRKP